jgi:phosphatidylinositol-3-phosphatase
VADRKDDQNPEGVGRGNCSECGTPLAADQRYCVNCGHRRGLLPGAVVGTLSSISSKGKAAAAAAGAKASGSKGDDGGGGWSWMPSPPAIAIAVIGMLALGVGLGSAMSEIASSAPISTILLEYPRHAVESAPEETEAEEPEEVGEEEAVAEAPVEEEAEEALPEEITEAPVLPEEAVEGGEEEANSEVPPPVEFNPEEEEENFLENEEEEETLPQVKHAWLIVLGENSYESLFSAQAGSPYLSRVLPGKGELLPHYYGVTGGVLANEIALLSGQGPTPETAVNCPNPNPVAPAAVSVFAEQVEGNGCVYPKTVESLPTQLEAKYAETPAAEAPKMTWRAYVEDMEKGGAIGQPWRCRKPTLGVPDTDIPVPGDQYANYRNPAVYFAAVSENVPECEKHDVGFELLTKDLKAKKATPTLSLIFPNACHSGGEVECEPGAPTGAKAVTKLLKTLVPAIMASPAYEEGGGMIMITSAQAPQVGEKLDPHACCLAPTYPNLAPLVGAPPAAPPAVTPPKKSATEGKTGAAGEATEEEAVEGEEATPTKYGEESVLATGGGGQVGLLMISPLVEEGKVEEAEYANHFTLLKTLETMLGLEPLGYATEEEVPTLSPELFIEEATEEEAGEVEEEAAQRADRSSRTASPSSATPRNFRMVGPVKRRDRRAPSWAPGRTPIESAIARLRP